MKKLQDKKSQRKSLNTNFMNFMSKNSQGSIIFAPQCYTGFKMLNFGEIKFDKEQYHLGINPQKKFFSYVLYL